MVFGQTLKYIMLISVLRAKINFTNVRAFGSRKTKNMFLNLKETRKNLGME